MKRRSALEEDVIEADEIAEQQKPAAPNKTEKQALSAYCALSLKIKIEEQLTKEALKHVKPQLKQLRMEILDDLKAQQDEVFQIPLAMRQTAQQKEGGKVPSFLRLSRNSRDLTITPAIISDAIRDTSDSDIMESTKEGSDALIDAILTGVRRQVRSFTEQAKLMDSVPRGMKAVDIPLAPPELCTKALLLHQKSCFVLDAERKKRESIAKFKGDMTQKEAPVQQYLRRSGITSQRVVLENVPYTLCSREREKKPRVTFALLQSALEDGLKECILKKRARAPTKEEIASCINQHKEELERRVQASLESLPIENVSRLSLVRLKT